MSAKCVDISDRHQIYKIWVIEQNLIFPCAFYTNEALLTSHFTPLHDPSTTAIAHAKLCGSIVKEAMQKEVADYHTRTQGPPDLAVSS